MEWTGAASSRRATAGDYSSTVWFVDVSGRDELAVEIDRAVMAITKKRRTLPPLRYRRADDGSSGAEKDGVAHNPVAPKVAKNQTGKADDAAMKTHDASQCFTYDAVLGGCSAERRCSMLASTSCCAQRH